MRKEKQFIITSMKYTADIEEPTINTGCVLNSDRPASIEEGTRYYDDIQEWIAEGNTPEPAFTQEEIDAHQVEFTYQELVAQINQLTVEYEGHTFSGSVEAQSFIIAMLTKIEGENPNSTRNIYAIDNRTKVPMTKTNLLELISIIDIVQEAITN